MNSPKSADSQSVNNSMAQTMGGLYLAVAALVLFMIVLLRLGGSAAVGARSGQTPAVEPAISAAAPAAGANANADTPAPVERAELYAKLAELGDKLSTEAAERNRLALQLEKLLALRSELSLRADKAAADPNDNSAAEAHAALLQNIANIEHELSAVSQALDVSEKQISANQVEVAGLGARLNRALLAKVEELQRGRSEFFSRLRDVLGERAGFKIEGDRFTLPSEVLFAEGSDRLRPQGLEEVRRLAATISASSKEIPPGIDWVLRVSGHTDKVPISNARFSSNWELSTMRAVNVVKTLIAAGVPAEHLAAAGFGEFQPLTTDDSPAGLARNRRIEFRIDQP